MTPPKEFRTVKQPAGSKLCGACVCAMATNLELDELLVQEDWRELMHTMGMARFLAKHDILMGTFLKCDEESWYDYYTFRMRTDGRPAIVAVKSAVTWEHDHWVFWDGMQFRDPSVEQEEYTVLEVYFLTYFEKADWIEQHQRDWRNEPLPKPIASKLKEV